MLYLILIICIVYVTDEIASQISTLMKTEIATDLLAKYGESSIGILDILGIVAFPFQGLSLLYKPLSDRYGRKLFLVINTLGMGIGLFFVFLSNNIALYVIGSTIVAFFVPHDMQVVYVTESSPPKHRAKIFSLVKCVSTLGLMLIPLLRRTLMADASEWRNVYLVPALLGIVVSFIALMLLRETDAFIESRLKYLRMTDEEREAEIGEEIFRDLERKVLLYSVDNHWMEHIDGMEYRNMCIENNYWSSWIYPRQYQYYIEHSWFDAMRADSRFDELFERLDKCAIRREKVKDSD